MNKIVILLGLLMTINGWATSVKISLSSKNPVVGDQIDLVFQINTQTNAEPEISFTPYNVEVLGKTNSGLSIRTTVINGRISAERTMSYVYRIVVPKVGTFRINEIEVDIEGKTYKHPNIVGLSLKEALKPKAIFAHAIPSKVDIFKGEGITVDYYLYFKVAVRGVEIEKFPKLNSFIKRFQKVKDNIETVEYKGEVFRRVKKYSARVYPQKVGTLKIDPIALRVAYQSRGNSFDPFGMSRTRTKTVNSRKIPINVKELPIVNVPKNFIGLVGKHSVSFDLSRTKYLVNEAIEARLVIEGPGELENLAPFKIYENQYLESFDIKENLEELANGKAKKIFDYTFLGRRNVSIDETNYNFSYFNPENNSYEESSIKLPALQIKGVAAKSNYGAYTIPDEESASGSTKSAENSGILSGFVAPMFIGTADKWSLTNYFPFIKYFLLLLLILVIILITRQAIVGGILDRDDEFSLSYKRAMKQQDYEALYFFLSFFLLKEGESIIKALERNSIKADTKEYFGDLLKSYELEKYSDIKESKKLKIVSKHFKYLYKQYYVHS